LHRIAQYHLQSERSEHTLQPTALVHEAYLRLFIGNQPQFRNRAHFLALTSIVMRRILVDYARARKAARRGGDAERVIVEDLRSEEEKLDRIDLLNLNAALEALAQTKESSARYLEMHYFGGMTAEEIAEATGRSVHTVRDTLRYARAWLRRYMSNTT
jgi:RNA polymerase sigma-70 factor, ECF subfamily